MTVLDIYASKEFKENEWKNFKELCVKRNSNAFQEIRAFIIKYNRLNGKGQITLNNALNNHPKQDPKKCSFCNIVRLKAILIDGNREIPVCVNHFFEFEKKYNAYKLLG